MRPGPHELLALPTGLKAAGAAAAALAVSTALPWYEKNYLAPGERRLRTETFHSVSFVELAVVVVAAAVLWLVAARATGRAFALPGGDGPTVVAAGAWALLLLLFRSVDHPDVAGGAATVGIAWGLFVALLAAGALLGAGLLLRAEGAQRPPER